MDARRAGAAVSCLSRGVHEWAAVRLSMMDDMMAVGWVGTVRPYTVSNKALVRAPHYYFIAALPHQASETFHKKMKDFP